jgi:hypothetical protein
MADTRWLPDGSIYLERADAPHVRPSRPYNQGDIFDKVPLASAGRGDDNPRIEVGPVILLGHPCSIRAGSRVIPEQLIAAIRVLDDAVPARNLQSPWATHRYLFPLPQLCDGQDYVADFRRVGTTHYKNLEGHRVACLTRDGWAALQIRWAWHTLRAEIPLAVRSMDLLGLWNELALEEEWTDRGFTPGEFPAWRDSAQTEGAFVGTKRADLLDYAFDELWGELPARGATLT